MTTNGASRTKQKRSSRDPSRAHRGLAIAGIALAVLFMAAAAIAGLNLAALGSLSQASDSLQHNLSAASRQDADLEALKARQEQTDAQFADASATSAVQLPAIRDAVRTNADTSRRLSAAIAAAQIGQRGGQGAKAATGEKSPASGGDDAHTTATNPTGNGLSTEQRKRVEQLLKQNSSGTSHSSAPSQEQSPRNDSTTKPW